MANVKISALPTALTPLTGTEEVPLVQASATAKATAQDIADLAISVGVSNAGGTPKITSDTFQIGRAHV